jgi:hypothetical protein
MSRSVFLSLIGGQVESYQVRYLADLESLIKRANAAEDRKTGQSVIVSNCILTAKFDNLSVRMYVPAKLEANNGYTVSQVVDNGDAFQCIFTMCVDAAANFATSNRSGQVKYPLKKMTPSCVMLEGFTYYANHTVQ